MLSPLHLHAIQLMLHIAVSDYKKAANRGFLPYPEHFDELNAFRATAECALATLEAHLPYELHLYFEEAERKVKELKQDIAKARWMCDQTTQTLAELENPAF